tara:strand:- start:604 stop:1230 length:627 start_codon:yes stop_codon:yes gene_type:complete
MKILEEKNKTFLIIAAGSSVREHKDKIDEFISSNNPTIVGINNITSLYVPKYHLWTNNERLRSFGSKAIKEKSNLMLGSGIKKNSIPPNVKKYETVNFLDKKELKDFNFDGNKFSGYFRTAGALAIYLCHHSNAKSISVVGMDGFTLNGRSGNQHLYGSGRTDDYSWDGCIKKDKIIYSCLKNLKNHGVKFSILTPTVYKDFQHGFPN